MPRPGPTGVEGVGGFGGPGCGARGRWQGLAGLRDGAPSRRLAARPARGRAAAHGHTKQPGPASSPAQRAARPSEQPGPAGGPPPTAQPGPTRQRVERSAEAEQIGRACRQLISSRAIRQQGPPTHRTLMDAE